jgi:predicted enzyme related to lactoylglutathione lyase
MEYGVSVIWFPVSDVGRSVDFYRDTLGLQVRDQQDQWAELVADGLTIGLNSHEEDSRAQGGGVLALRPKGGIDAAVQELESRGVTFVGAVSEHPWGRVATFKDPDGNDLQLYQPPAS